MGPGKSTKSERYGDEYGICDFKSHLSSSHIFDGESTQVVHRINLVDDLSCRLVRCTLLGRMGL